MYQQEHSTKSEFPFTLCKMCPTPKSYGVINKSILYKFVVQRWKFEQIKHQSQNVSECLLILFSPLGIFLGILGLDDG